LTGYQCSRYVLVRRNRPRAKSNYDNGLGERMRSADVIYIALAAFAVALTSALLIAFVFLQ
jgi:hypothetical protein